MIIISFATFFIFFTLWWNTYESIVLPCPSTDSKIISIYNVKFVTNFFLTYRFMRKRKYLSMYVFKCELYLSNGCACWISLWTKEKHLKSIHGISSPLARQIEVQWEPYISHWFVLIPSHNYLLGSGKQVPVEDYRADYRPPALPLSRIPSMSKNVPVAAGW